MSATTSASAKGSSKAAVKAACARIENLLSKSPAYRKVDDGLYVIKQGSTLVMVSVHPWKQTHAVVRLVAQLVKGVTMEVPLALELLELNSVLRFGAFAWVPAGEIILFCHTMADRELSDAEEFITTVRDFALVADDYDDRIAARYGGQTMQELIEESVVARVRDTADHPFLK
jgi:hypothetical protein